MTKETKKRIRAYTEALPHMREKVFGALLMLVIAATVATTATYAWVTLSRAPEVSHIATSMAANGALEIALAKPDGSMPEEFDIDESLAPSNDVTVSNLQWGNLVNLSHASYGIDNMALRPAQLNTTSLLTSPLWGAAYGEDGRITNLDSNYAYAKYNGSQFLTSYDYGVRAIATYEATISDETQKGYDDKVKAAYEAHTAVNQAYELVAPRFSSLGTMISKYAQTKLDDTAINLAPYVADMLPLYEAIQAAMEKQMEAYVALANLQNYLYCNETGGTYAPLTWANLVTNKAQYNTASANVASSHGYISLVGLTQFIKDYEQLVADHEHLIQYNENYKNNTNAAYYWGGTYVVDGATVKDDSASGYALSNIVDHLISYTTMTIDLNNDGNEVKVVSLGMDQASALLGANGKERKVYAHNGILFRLEQSSIDESYRINGNASCTIKVTYMMTITVYGKAYTKASGPCYFMQNYSATLGTELAPKDAVAQDTYGLAVDLWLRTNAEQTCLTLEGATSTDEQGNIVSYDGVNRVWGATGEAMLTTDSTTQGGGSCYIYYADTPEDMARSLELLDAMKVAFVDSNGTLLATAEMDTAHPWAVNGRITVPLVLDNQTKTTYNYVDSMNVEQIGRAITTMYTDLPIRITAIVYLDGTRLTNDHVLAAAEIQGSLNIQFGSSLELKTLGSNELIDDTRTVTATVSPTELDYDTATSEADLTTGITVNVEGVDPTHVTAFFVRAINSTQGTREPEMTFTKQSNGTWTCDYVFTSPGTYYLRHVRLDGVDYTLADPQKVEVAGFGLNSVTWSETSDSVVVRTSDGSHSTSVTVNFASNDPKKLPSSVQARFVRDDGNTVNVPLTYNANGNWVGTGTFTASGVYQLQYLVANGNRYIDLALTDGSYRTMDLSLGMYVTVTDLSGGLWEEYEENKTYPKNVSVRVFNNADVEIAGLEGLVLRYSNGTSGTNLISADLTWNELDGDYVGTLPIVNPGRYMFSSVTVGGNLLTKCPDSPTYIVISPDPPIFDVSSGCTLNVDGVQYVPLTNDAKIDGITIANADSASASAVVYSAVTGEYYDVAMHFAGSSWYVALPTYDGTTVVGQDANGDPIYEQLQDGVWSLAAIYLWDCYAYDEFHDSTSPVLWVDSTLGNGYLATLSGVTADERLDFSALSTDVSAKVNVTMSAGTTALGSTTDPFGRAYPVSTTGMSVTITDGVGRVIPEDKITDVTLNYSYNGNDDTAYGYKVSGYSVTDAIKLNTQDGETGARTVSSEQTWTYVGKYTVNSLVITVGGKTLTYSGGDTAIGVPGAYTVTTKGPTADDVLLDGESYKQTYTEFGGTADNVTGTFLQAYNLDSTNVTIKLVGETGNLMSYAVLDGLTANLVLTHQGDSQTYGGYTFSGDTGYQDLTLAMTEKTTGSGTYHAPSSQTLLAGTYKAKMEITVGGVTETINLKNITVRSVLPDVKITGVSPTTEVTVSTNDDPSTNYLTANNTTTFKATNQYGDYYAVVYMGYAVGAEGFYHSSNGACGLTNTPESVNDYANYTKPLVTFALSDFGISADSTMDIPGNQETVSWSVDADKTTAETSVGIGSIVAEDTEIGSHKYGGSGWSDGSTCKYMCTIDKATSLGSVTIETIKTTVGNATYTRTLATPVVISQLSQENPTLTWGTITGVAVKVANGSTTYTGTTAVPAMTQLTATVTAEFGYHTPTLAEPDGVYNWKCVDSNVNEAVYTFQITDNVTLNGSATKYPAITFADGGNAAVAVTVDGTSITSNTGAKAGSTVVVTVTSDKDKGYCLPRLTKPSGITWTAKEGDFESTYTFTMPSAAVALSTPTTGVMYKLTWTEHTALTFYVEDSNGVIANGDYVVPDHTLTINLQATGGVNPELTAPADATMTSSSDFVTAYTYKMPYAALHMTATADSYPAVKLDNDYATFKVYSNNVEVSYAAGEGVSIKPGYTVKVELTAKDGWYAPRMSQPTDGTNWKVVVEPDNMKATYSFTMPNAEVNASGNISATAAPAVNITESNATATFTYTDYAGIQHTGMTDGKKVQPGVAVTVAVETKDNCYAPRMTEPSGVTDWAATGESDWTSGYSFTMGTSAVNLRASATAMPTLTLSASNATLSVKYTGYKDSSPTVTSGSVRVKPNTSLSITVTEGSNYYNPTVSASGVTLTGSTVDSIYSTRTYTSANITSDVTLTASAKAYPTLTYVKGNQATLAITVSGGTLGENQPVQIRPGTKISWTANYTGSEDRYVVFTPEGGSAEQQSEGAQTGTYTMPENNVTATASSTYTLEDGVGDVVECVTPDTLITLADGTQVRVDSLDGDEMLLVWNMETGKLDSAPIMFVDSEPQKECEVIYLYFSDGTEVKVIAEHGFWDYEMNRYVYLDENAAQYIGHTFAKQNGDKLEQVKLVDVVIKKEITTAWSPVTAGHLCYFVNGMLSMPGGVGGLFNIFDVDADTMTYDYAAIERDIATYGLFTYEELNAICPLSEDMFNMAGGAYLKISIGKGNLTMDELVGMITRYSKFFD